ncbi:hypothetical protein GCM10009560_57710 [Nonomuraea longicatena]|uniref:DUF1266 domain-containing protein n=1 Tax=Nonomuraea longicatena TaxID=83682 RepID=A0ABP4B009_9ACTN
MILPVLPDPPDGRPWQAPAALEERLYGLCQAREAGDERASYDYLRVIAAQGLYRPVPIHAGVDAPPVVITLSDGTRVVVVYTAGVLPQPHDEIVYEFVTLHRLGRLWPDDVEALGVNLQTPCEAWFAFDEEEREIWTELTQDLFRPDDLADRVETRRTGTPADKETLRGLACGAHLCYANGDAWNTLDWHGAGFSAEVERLAESWGITDHDSWADTQQRLLACEVSPWAWDFTLDARTWLLQQFGRADITLWRDTVEQTLRDRISGSVPEEEIERTATALRLLVGQIARYEARFRADGLLPPDGHVRTVAAWDLGRATMVARWGLGARHATQHEMRTAVERAGADVRNRYGDWAEFSAGYVLGRCLHFDEETFGTWYTSVLDAHHALTSAPDSPWLTVPLH